MDLCTDDLFAEDLCIGETCSPWTCHGLRRRELRFDRVVSTGNQSARPVHRGRSAMDLCIRETCSQWTCLGLHRSKLRFDHVVSTGNQSAPPRLGRHRLVHQRDLFAMDLTWVTSLRASVPPRRLLLEAGVPFTMNLFVMVLCAADMVDLQRS
ncbi:hypothetical protein TRIUR3_29913 [Triticum urartu]|uniref:Uncharacterized protein n=1 Tax=Triticum urartu TaxID=4572 RepID=M7YQ96_TRIUA|nr:hypothetical protein TRIUR3_29913 [Triticum urartu]